MISVLIHSGLGNQMFQYALGCSMQRKNIVLFHHLETSHILKYFKLSKWDFIYRTKNIYVQKIIRKTINYIKNKNIYNYTDCSLPLHQFQLNQSGYYEGYFQSCIFFEKQKKAIQTRFQIRKKFQIQFNNQYASAFLHYKTLVIHIRRGDYLTHGLNKNLGSIDLSLPIIYYKHCLSMIEDLKSYKIFIVGDDMEFIVTHFSNLPNVSFEQNDPIIDFQLIMNSDIAIISNSTFAWWAAYLNKKKNKRILAPKYFLGFHIQQEFPNGISKNLSYEWIDVTI
jgi:hypothetical protein